MFNILYLYLISISYQLNAATGSIEAVIDDNCGMTKFLSIANALVKECKVKLTAKEDNSDYKDTNVVAELASLLEKKFF
ncbi:MAG: hypothetical protein WKG06_14130 [Segetibacter sp.]